MPELIVHRQACHYADEQCCISLVSKCCQGLCGADDVKPMGPLNMVKGIIKW